MPVTVLTAVLDDPTGYGRILRDADGLSTASSRSGTPSPEQRAVTEMNAGIYAFDAQRCAPPCSRSAPTTPKARSTSPTSSRLVRSSGGTIRGHLVDDTWQTEGVNDRVQLARLGAELNRRVVERWMREGVTVVDPATTWLDVDVSLGRDVTIRPHTQLLGATTIGDGVTIGPDTTLADVEVGDGATVVRTQATLAVIGAGATVGPFSYLRPGTRLGARGKIGGFVETKNASDRRRRQGAAPVLRRRRRRSARAPTSAPARSSPTTTAWPSTTRPSGALPRRLATTCSWRRVEVGDGALHRRGLDRPPGRPAGRAGRERRAASATSRAGSPADAPGSAGRRAAAAQRRTATSDSGTVRHPSSTRRELGESASSHDGEEPDALLGRAHPELAEEVAELARHHAGADRRTYDFANGEIYVRFEESVRGCDAFVIQSHTAPINEWIMEQLIMVDALKRASAKRITVVLPFYGYARQDKKHRGREPISARLMADLFKTAGADRLMAVDLHTAQIQGFFDGPVDHLCAHARPRRSTSREQLRRPSTLAVVSPDAGRIRVAEQWSTRLGGAPLAFIHKTPRHHAPNEVRSPTGSSATSRAGSACSSTT